MGKNNDLIALVKRFMSGSKVIPAGIPGLFLFGVGFGDFRYLLQLALEILEVILHGFAKIGWYITFPAHISFNTVRGPRGVPGVCTERPLWWHFVPPSTPKLTTGRTYAICVGAVALNDSKYFLQVWLNLSTIPEASG